MHDRHAKLLVYPAPHRPWLLFALMLRLSKGKV